MDALLVILGPVLQVGIASAMLWRRVVGRFRFFFAYTIYSVLAGSVDLWTKGNTQAYFLSYSISEIIYGALGLLAIHEAFRDILKAYYRRHAWTRRLPPLLVLALIVASVWRCLYHPLIRGGALMTCLTGGTQTYGLGVRSLEICIFLLYLFSRRRYRLRRYNKGVILGFGLYAFVSLASYLLHSNFGAVFESWYRYLSPGAYFSAALFWLATFLGSEPPLEKQALDESQVRRAGAAMEGALENLEQRSGRKRD